MAPILYCIRGRSLVQVFYDCRNALYIFKSENAPLPLTVMSKPQVKRYLNQFEDTHHEGRHNKEKGEFATLTYAMLS